MNSKLRSAAETRFAAISRRDDATMDTIAAEREATREKTDRLRRMRLENEANTIAKGASQLKAKRRILTLSNGQ